MIHINSAMQEDALAYQSPNGRYSIRYKIIGNQIIISESEGYIEYESAQIGFQIFEKIIVNLGAAGQSQPIYYVADARNISGIDWKSRQYLVTQLSQLFDQEVIYSGALVGSDFLTRTLANLVLVFSKKASIAFFDTQEEALLQLKQQQLNAMSLPALTATSDVPTGIKKVPHEPAEKEEVCRPSTEWHYMDHIYVNGQKLIIEHLPGWSNSSPDGMYQFRALLINQNIVFIKESGVVDAEKVERGYDILHKVIQYSRRTKLFVISDFSEVKVMPLEARKVVERRNVELTPYWKHGYLILSHWTRVVYRLYRILRLTDPVNATLCDTLEEAFERCFKFSQHQSMTAITTNTLSVAQNPDLSRLSREELLQYVSQLQEENVQLKNHQQERINELFKTIGRITWDDSFRPDLKNISEDDPFYMLYTSISLLQNDVYEMVDKLKKLNRKLERKVEKRTQKIMDKELNLRSVLENNDIAIALVSKHFELIDYNSLMADLILHTWGIELRRQWNIDEFLLRSPNNDLWQTRFREVLDGHVGTYQHNITLGSSEHVCEIKLFPIRREAEVVGLSIFVKDITQSVMTERILLAQNEELKKLNSELDRFVYSSAHDLRAPLTSMLGIINILKADLHSEEADIDATQNYLNLMDRCIQKMDSFIRDIVNFSKNSRLDVVREPVDFRELFEGIFESLHFMDSSKNIDKKVIVEGEGAFCSDYRRLNVVFNNLISNAIRYSHSFRTDPFVHIYVRYQTNGVSIEVRDNGQGIPEEHQSRIFDMFYRASSHSSGSGLGLYIVKESVAKLKGTIRVESHFDQGTSFFLDLPSL